MSHKRNLKVTLALSATVIAAAFAPSAQATEVCNEARKNHPGNYNASDPDPNPPARFKTGLQPIGNVDGLVHAAGRSPALSVCGPADGGGDTGGGDTGGGDGGDGGGGGVISV